MTQTSQHQTKGAETGGGPAVASLARAWFSSTATTTVGKGGLSLVDQAVVSATSLISGVVLGRACGKEALGLYTLGFTIILFLVSIQNSLITSPYSVYGPRRTGRDHAGYAGSTLLHQFSLSAVALIVLALSALLSLRLGKPQLASMLWVLVFVATFILVKEHVRRTSFARLDMQSALVLDVVVGSLQVVLLLMLAWNGALSLERCFVVIGAACGAGAAGWVVLNRHTIALCEGRVLSDLARNVAFGKWMLVGDFTVQLTAQLYPWYLAFFHGVSDTGLFAAYLSIASLSNPLLLGLKNMLLPKMVHAYTQGGPGELQRIVQKATILLTASTAVLCVVVAFAGAPLVALLYGRQYAGGTHLIVVLALGVLAKHASVGFAFGLVTRERPFLNFKVDVLPLTLTLTLGCWLVRAFGPLGAAYGLLLGFVLGSLLRYVVYSRLTCSASTGEAQR